MFVSALCAQARGLSGFGGATPARATGKSRGRRACRRPSFYVSRVTKRRSILSSRSGCANRRCSRILLNVSTNRRRSARRAEARTNNLCKASRDGVNCGSTMQECLQDGRRQPHACVCVRCAAEAHGLSCGGSSSTKRRSLTCCLHLDHVPSIRMAGTAGHESQFSCTRDRARGVGAARDQERRDATPSGKGLELTYEHTNFLRRGSPSLRRSRATASPDRRKRRRCGDWAGAQPRGKRSPHVRAHGGSGEGSPAGAR